MNPYILTFTLFLAVLMAYNNWKINHNSIYLSGFIVVTTIHTFTIYYLFNGKSPFWLAVFVYHTNPLSYLRGPFLYFYIRGMLYDQTTLKKKDWLHFIPFFIS